MTKHNFSDPKLPDSVSFPNYPVYFGQLPEERQLEFLKMLHECLPGGIHSLSSEQLGQLHYFDVRSLLELDDPNFDPEKLTEEAVHSVWITGRTGRACIGHLSVWHLFLAAALDSGWRPQDSDTRLPVQLPHVLGAGDALSLARTLRSRHKGNGIARAKRMMDAVISILLSGSVAIDAGPEPDYDDLFLKEPKHRPHLSAV